jgi:hypothetical protein
MLPTSNCPGALRERVLIGKRQQLSGVISKCPHLALVAVVHMDKKRYTKLTWYRPFQDRTPPTGHLARFCLFHLSGTENASNFGAFFPKIPRLLKNFVLLYTVSTSYAIKSGLLSGYSARRRCQNSNSARLTILYSLCMFLASRAN